MSEASNHYRTRWLCTLVGLCLPTLITYVYFTLLHGAPAWQQKSAFSVGKVLQVALPCLVLWSSGAWMSGHRGEDVRSSVLFGLLSGCLIGAAIYLFYRFALTPLGIMAVPDREVEAKLRSLNLNSVPVYVLVGIGYALVHSLFEEYYWRWFVFGNLKTLLRLPLAIAISSLGFAAHHVLVLANYFGWWSPWTYLCSLGVATGGAIWAWLYHRHQTLFGPWISHGLVDAVIFVIGYELAFS